MKRAGRAQFAHDPISDELLAVFAPGLHLRRIHSHSGRTLLIDVHHRRSTRRDHAIIDDPMHPLSRALFTNSSSLQSAVGPVSTLSTQVRQSNACFVRKMEVEVMWDKSFCALFDGNVSFAVFQTRATIANVISVYDTAACVQVTIIKYSTYCKLRRIDPLARPSSLDVCPPSSPKCSRPLRILETVRNFWWSKNEATDSSVSPDADESPDAVLFLSGYDDGTPVSGAAYIGGTCSSYKFGWVEGLEYAVIGHELGHLLGASHSSSGLMKRVISLTQEPTLSKQSAQTIQNFVKKQSTGWCLSRDSGQQNVRSILDNFTMTVGGDLVPLNFDLYYSVRFKGARFMMVLKNKTDLSGPVSYFAYTGLALSGEDINKSTTGWKKKDFVYGPYLVPSSQTGEIVCSDVTLSPFKSPIILTIRQNGNLVRASYLTVLDDGAKSITSPKKWGNEYFVPAVLSGMRVQSCSIDATTTQLIFAYARTSSKWQRTEIYYSAGRRLSRNGAIQNGWSRAFRVPIAIRGRVITMGVTVFKVVAGYEEDLIFSYIYVDKKNVKHTKIVVGFGLNADGTVSGGWSSELEFTLPNNNEIRKDVGFGINVSPRQQYNSATKRTVTQRLPTISFVDTIVGGEFYRLFMLHEALADGMFNRANVTEHSELIPPCENCYSNAKSGRCVIFRLSCSEIRTNMLPIDTVISKRAASMLPSNISTSVSLQQISAGSRQRGINGSSLGYPDLAERGGELYCAGVYKLFIVKTGGDCAGKVSNAWIATAGLAQRVEEIAPDQISKTEDFDPEDVGLLVQFDVAGSTSEDDASGAFVKVDKKGPSNITILSTKKLRSQTIQTILKRVIAASDYNAWFRNDSKKKPKIGPSKRVKRGKYNFLVFIKVPWSNLL